MSGRVLASLCLSFVLAFALAACSKDRAGAASAPAVELGDAALRGESNGGGSLLAYEHEVGIRSDASSLAQRMASVREACVAQKFGSCSLLGEERQAGEQPSGNMRMRVTPAAVEPLVKLAAQGGEIGQRSTHAEDLADAVADNGLRQRRLQAQHAKLLEILERKDLKVEDMIALSQQLAAVEADLQGAGQEAAQQRRRIETNLLTLRFESSGFAARSSAVRQAFANLGSVFDVSLAALITVVGGVLPFALFFGLIALGWRWYRRRIARRG